MKHAKKLIEVALPLDAINEASVREKSIRHGHPSTLHLWWARRPLAAARAVIFAQMVDDPSEYVDVLLSDPQKKHAAERDLRQRLAKRTEREMDGDSEASEESIPTLGDVIAEHERDRLFRIIKALVKWENTTNETVLGWARDEIWQSWRRACANNADHPRTSELFNRHQLPAFHDPFAGGGALPLEAQRLGLEAFASDLNPVAVLINKATIEIPPRFVNRPPVNPESRTKRNGLELEHQGTQGLAEDILYYGKKMRDEAKKRIGHLYPQIKVTAQMANYRPDLKEYIGRNLTVIAWIWARTVKSPNPAYSDVHVPLLSSFILSKRNGKIAYIDPILAPDDYWISVKIADPTSNLERLSRGTKHSRGSFRCLMSNISIPYDYIDGEANAGRMSARMVAIIAEGDRTRVFLPPTDEMEKVARSAVPNWVPSLSSRGTWASNAQGRPYGFKTFGDYFTPRQLVALNTFSDILSEVHKSVYNDAIESDFDDDNLSYQSGGTGATAYADSVAIYLSFVLSKQADLANSLCRWEPIAQCPRQLFTRQAIPMVWDYAEGNPLGNSSGAWITLVNGIIRAFSKSFGNLDPTILGHSRQANAEIQDLSFNKIVSTDPPYYDNILYSDLSEFFYIWIRRSLKPLFPDLLATISVPKSEELVANSYRYGGKKQAEKFFLNGMSRALKNLTKQAHSAFPITIYYAFKQAEKKVDTGVISTGWETFLDAVICANLAITGTWPIRTENSSRMVGQGTNALASSIVLVCRPKPLDAAIISLREFIVTLKQAIHTALAHLQHSSVAPVDLAQAAIGPGMAVYSRYSRVIDAAGRTVTVREALKLINQVLDEVLAEQDSVSDSESRWAVAWFEQFGFLEGDYGSAETLSKAKNTSVSGLIEAGILASNGGKIRLLKPEELSSDWDPQKDSQLTAWEVVHHLIRVLKAEGEESASHLLRKLGPRAETAHELCYRLFTLSERKKRFADATSYNTLVRSWPEIAIRARAQPTLQSGEMFGERK